MLKLSLVIIGVCQWFHSLKCYFINSDVLGAGPVASRLMDDCGEPGWRRLRPCAAPPLSPVRQSLLKAQVQAVQTGTVLAAVPSQPFLVVQ